MIHEKLDVPLCRTLEKFIELLGLRRVECVAEARYLATGLLNQLGDVNLGVQQIGGTSGPSMNVQ